MTTVLQLCGGTPKKQQLPQYTSLNPQPAFESLAGDGLFYTAGFSLCCATNFTCASLCQKASLRWITDLQ